MTITEIGDLLRGQPIAWRDIPQQQRDICAAALIPHGVFTQEQRYYLARWWLACTQDDVDAINAVLPDETRVSAIEIGGALYLGGDLLTDSLIEGNTYYPAQALLQGLVCTYIEPEST